MVSVRGSIRNNLPANLTTFIGREREITEVARLLAAARLVTLTGTGGCGKSRLAVEVARVLMKDFSDGVWVAELAALSEAALVPYAVAGAIEVLERPGTPMVATLGAALRAKTILLVLDNCEHLRAACAPLADALLRECPNLRIFATSREPLGVPGETIWRVPSLSSPNPRQLPPAEHPTQYESIRLFAQRAASALPGFRVTNANARAVAMICDRLDGIPLAIELAAARVRTLAVEQIAARLDDRFRLLTGGSSTVLPRHRTLRGALDWSFHMLSENERAVLRRLSVFAGGFTLEAAEAVCSGDGVQREEVFDLVAQLANKSLVIAETQEREAWYRMLETVRQYGRDRLAESGEALAVRARHGDWYLALAEHAEAGLGGAESTWLDRLETEHDNLRAALEWYRSTPEGVEPGLRLATAIRAFWERRGYFTEGRAWLDGMLPGAGAMAPLLRAKALNAAGVLAYRQGDYGRVSALCGEALALCEQHEDARGGAMALHFLAHVRQACGDYDRATEMMERSVAQYQAAGDKSGVANSVDCLGEVARSKGDYERAATFTQHALALYAEVGEERGRAHVLHNLGYVRLHQGHPDEAAALFRESLIRAQEGRFTRDIILAVAGLAASRARSRPPERVVELLGAVDALLGTAGIHNEPAELADFDRTVAAARARLGEEAFDSAWTRGREMTLDATVEDALALGAASAEPEASQASRGGTLVGPLTPREREVAALIAQGLTNREIAASLVISERTAEGHVQSILNKLGFGSRAQIAAWAVKHDVADGHNGQSV